MLCHPIEGVFLDYISLRKFYDLYSLISIKIKTLSILVRPIKIVPSIFVNFFLFNEVVPIIH